MSSRRRRTRKTVKRPRPADAPARPAASEAPPPRTAPIPPESAPADGPRSQTVALALAVALVAATVTFYWPVHGLDFIGYDDPRYVTNNDAVKKGFAEGSVSYAFQGDDGGNWNPLTWFSHMLDVEIGGLDPAVHHVSQLVYHVLATVLLFLALRALTGAPGRSAFVAGAFALHPLHVESVAWIAERKDTLSGVLWMATLWAYAGYARSPNPGRYLLVAAVFALGLMAKPMVVTLPLVLLLLDVWPLRRVELPPRARADWRRLGRLVVEKVPLLLLSVAGSWITVIMQRRVGAVMSTSVTPIALRVQNAIVSYVTYLWKTLWPADLAVFYPYPDAFPASQVAAALVFLLGVTAAALYGLRRRPYLAVGWFWYLGTLVPVIGIVQVGSQAMADRYAYIPLVGIFIALAWGAVDLVGTRLRATGLAAAAVVVLLGWGVVTRAQLAHWKNDETLYSHALAVTEDNYLIHHNFGVSLATQKRYDEAIEHYREAVRINGFPSSRLNLGVLLSDRGDASAAIANYEEALRRNPRDTGARNNLANALSAEGRHEEALVHFEQVVRIQPNYFQAHSNYALALFKAGHYGEAVDEARAALRLRPNFAQAHNVLAASLAAQGRPQQAIASFQEALRLLPRWPPATRRLAWLYATYPDAAVRNGAEAVRLAEEANGRTGNKDAEMLDTLAAAYAEQGLFVEARNTAERARAAAENAGNQELAEEIRGRIELYGGGQPYRAAIAGG